jgi:integrase/recombinase XerD
MVVGFPSSQEIRQCSQPCSSIQNTSRGTEMVKRISPHSIRHSCATHLLRAGVDINTIQGWLGHVSLNITNIYAEIDLETKAKALALCAVADGRKTAKRWGDQPALMEFLRAL